MAKESRWEGDDSERLSTLKVSIAQTNRAADLAGGFNEALEWCRMEGIPPISVVPCQVYRLSMPNGSVRYMSVERWLDGRFVKHNGNNGYIGAGAGSQAPVSAASAPSLLPHAFSHWSFEHTAADGGSAAMVVDIQGVGLTYTDVTVHSADRRYGNTDLGDLGFQNFFRTHECNAACGALGLTRCVVASDPGLGHGEAASASTATERIQLIRTKHLQHRKREREVDTIEMQRAVKHGRKEPGAGVNSTVKHTHQGVSVVTDASGTIGVTAFRQGPAGGVWPISHGRPTRAAARAAPAVPTFGGGGWGR